MCVGITWWRYAASGCAQAQLTRRMARPAGASEVGPPGVDVASDVGPVARSRDVGEPESVLAGRPWAVWGSTPRTAAVRYAASSGLATPSPSVPTTPATAGWLVAQRRDEGDEAGGGIRHVPGDDGHDVARDELETRGDTGERAAPRRVLAGPLHRPGRSRAGRRPPRPASPAAATPAGGRARSTPAARSQLVGTEPARLTAGEDEHGDRRGLRWGAGHLPRSSGVARRTTMRVQAPT